MPSALLKAHSSWVYCGQKAFAARRYFPSTTIRQCCATGLYPIWILTFNPTRASSMRRFINAIYLTGGSNEDSLYRDTQGQVHGKPNWNNKPRNLLEFRE